MRVPAGETIQSPCGNRRGASLLTVVQLQLVISAALLSLGGFCLHTALRSDRLEQHSLMLLRSLTRLEEQLRTDERMASGLQVVSATELQIAGTAEDGGSVTWRVDRNLVERIEGDSSNPIAFEKYVFPAGTRVEFGPSTVGVLVQIYEFTPGRKLAQVLPVIELQLSTAGGNKS